MKCFMIVLFFWVASLSGQEIAKNKCLEYAQAVYQEADEIFSFRSRDQTNISTCAIFENPLIVGGTPARTREFPHMAVIGFGQTDDSDLDWLCGGSLISQKHVLTAAHCTISQSGPPQRIRLGTINLDVNDDYIQEIIIDKFINHPNYKRPKKYHDIAIMFLRTEPVFTAFVRPACLGTSETISYDQAIVSGFGRTSYGDNEVNTILLKVKIDIISKEDCLKYIVFRKMEMPEGLIKEMLCAGYLKGGRDTCQGDSGGPLQVILEEPYCMYSIIGVTSFGRFCGMSNSPGIYTKVDQYVPWIESTIWK